MALKYASGLRTTRITAVLAAIDVGGSAGDVVIYSGTQFVTTTVLATIPLAYPCGTVSGAVLTFNTSPSLTGTGTGAAGSGGTTATWARIRTSAAASVVEMTVGQAGDNADLTLTNKVIVTNGVVSITAGSITEGNA